MKNSIKLNIGLSRQDGRENTVRAIGDVLRHYGFIPTTSRLVTGVWEGAPETTLAVECLCSLPLCHAECRLATQTAIQRIAVELNQTCIALVWPDGHGELLPPVATFDRAAFADPEETAAPRHNFATAMGLSNADLGPSVGW